MTVVTRFLNESEILQAANEMDAIYPRVVSIVFWRAWEVAAYRHHALTEPVLDLACGDGRFFRFLWPNVTDVVGIDHDAAACENARATGVYKDVHQVPAHRLPFEDNSFASLFPTARSNTWITLTRYCARPSACSNLAACSSPAW